MDKTNPNTAQPQSQSSSENQQFPLDQMTRDKIAEQIWNVSQSVKQLQKEKDAQRAEIVWLKSRIAELEAEKN